MMGLAIGLAIAAIALSIWCARLHRRARDAERKAERASGEAQSAAQSQALVDEAHLSLVRIEPDGKSVDGSNPAGVRVICGADGELRAEVRESMAAALRDGAPQSLSIAGGGQRCRVTLMPRATTPGSVVAIVQPDAGRDGEQERVSRLAARNEAILRSSMDGFFVVGEDYRFIEVNQAFARMTGYSPAELLEMTILDLEVDEPERSKHGKEYARTGLHQFPTAHRHRDGHTIFLELSVNVVRDGDRKLIVGFARDVTERRHSDQALIRLTRQKKLILNSAAEGIVGFDANGEVSFVNAAAGRMLGRLPGEMIGRSAQTFLSGQDGIDALARGEIAESREGVFMRADGAELPVEFGSTPMHEGGKFVGAVLVFSDISARRRVEQERRKLEAQVSQSQRLESLGLLAGGIAHDFNNILVGVLGNACLAQEEVGEDSPVRPRLQRIVNAGQRASRLVHQILAYAGQARPDLQSVALNDQVREVLEFMRPSLPERVSLKTCFEPELPPVHADEGQLEQVLTNLLLNAVEAVGDKAGRVTVSTHSVTLTREAAVRDFAGQEIEPGPFVGLEVTDSGCGMTPEVLARIFDPFFSGKKRGRGLGLAVIRGIVRSHGGGIQVASAPNKGTRFEILLPQCQARDVQETLDRTPAPASSAGRRTILVIDDESDVCEVVSAVLEPRGTVVLTTQSGREGIELFRAHSQEIDVVLLDVTMPEMSGIEVLVELRKIRPDVRVVLSSGYVQADLASDEIARTATGFLHKPYTIDGLLG
ncbi:MAG: PAS domain S-box protein, partial [Planctomycetes bacterium]|nr:PAS domain S-box protein [Planctomycetota bacterium]